MIAAVINALQLPDNCRVEQRVPKKTLTEHGAPTAADKRHIQDGIEELFWIAAMKPGNIGVPAFCDEAREYIEIAVLTLTLRPEAKAARLIELIHRAIPYPVFLACAKSDATNLSVAHKRFSEGQKDKYVLEDVCSVELDFERGAAHSDLLASLAISRLTRTNLFDLYQDWFHRFAAYQAAAITGTFALPPSNECAISVKDSLDSYATLTKEIQALRSQAAKEKQLNRRVELNVKIKRLESELAALKPSLEGKGAT